MQGSVSPILVQITDLHISPQWDENARRLEIIIQAINREIRPFLTLITGDLVHDGLQINAYEYLRTLLRRLEAPYYLIPGNHDNRSALKQVFYDASYMDNAAERIEYIIDTPQLPFALLALDTVVPGKFYGQLSEEQIQRVCEVCQTLHKPLIIFMHHPPLTPATVDPHIFQHCKRFLPALLDGLKFIGAEAFADQVSGLSSLRAILSGHLHLSTQLSWQGVSLIIAPSVAPSLKGAIPYKDHLAHIGMFLHKHAGLAVHRWDPHINGFISSFQYYKLPT